MTKKEAKAMCRLERDARQTLEKRKARAFDAMAKETSGACGTS